jgi:ABC-type cobalamin/Fe3+-siderophores transport system ATPase subunit
VVLRVSFIQGLWMNIAKDQLFCLLGPNGAGKTTTINCLTGLFPVTGGDGKIKLALFSCFCFIEASVLSLFTILISLWLALTALIYGNSIRSSVGMSNIRKMIGFCPQVSHFLLLSASGICFN